MKQIALILALCFIVSAPAFAKDKEVTQDAKAQIEKLDLQIQLNVAKFNAVQQEFNYIAERQKNLRSEAADLKVQIETLQKQKAALKPAEDK